MGLILCFTAGVAGLCAMAYLLRNGAFLKGAESPKWYLVQVMSGCVSAGGNAALSYGIATNYTYAAYISAVMPTNAIMLAILCLCFLRESLSTVQVAAMIIARGGLALMAFSD